MPVLKIGSLGLQADQLLKGFREKWSLQIDRTARQRILRSRKIVEAQKKPAYAINTGLGSLKEKIISPQDLNKLSENVLRSHACGSGRPLPREISSLMLLLRTHALALGYSGVRLLLVEKLIELYDKEILGVVYEHGSVGSSGDLVPLAHLALPLIGEGEVWDGETIRPAATVLKKRSVHPIRLANKEGVSLINGTQFMLAHALLFGEKAQRLLHSAHRVAALSLEALRGSRKPFHPFLHERRPIPEIVETARLLWELLDGSQILASHKDCTAVQDAYSLRCIPQVHGSCLIALNNLSKIVRVEVFSSTDNPLVSIDSQEILSGGNFHGEPLAGALDYVGISFTKLSNISERRIARLVDPALSGLPAFLIEAGGLNSGFMIPQYTAASIVAENKVLSHPASADSIPTSANQEDINSLGSISGKKALRILENTEQVIGIELLTALQALDLSLKGSRLRSSPPLEKIRARCRREIPFVTKDLYLKPLMDKAIALVRKGL